LTRSKKHSEGFCAKPQNVCFLREEPEHHNISAGHRKAEALVQNKKAIEAKGEFKKVPLDPRVPDRTVCIGAEVSQQEQAEQLAFPDKIAMFLYGQPPI
jgi:hypothetical protein